MGNTQSMKKINYEDMQTVIKNPEIYLKEMTLPTFQIDYPVKCACTGLMYFPEHTLSDKIINDLGLQNTEDDQIVCNNYLTQQLSKNDVDYYLSKHIVMKNSLHIYC